MLILLVALPGTAWAHRVNVFAHVEGDTLHVEGYFQRGVPAKQSPVEVRNGTTGQLYIQGETDVEGRAALTIPPRATADRADLDIVLRAGEGHQNHWVVKAEEYLPANPRPTHRPTSQATPRVSATASPPYPAQNCPPPTDPTPLIEAAVERKIAPLRDMLLANQEPGLKEIIGGIGYLVGIAGLLAYARSRRPASGQS
ncbi:MAG: hypothetical protein AB1899_02750 [Pseudomonadota bacterium]